MQVRCENPKDEVVINDIDLLTARYNKKAKIIMEIYLYLKSAKSPQGLYQYKNYEKKHSKKKPDKYAFWIDKQFRMVIYYEADTIVIKHICIDYHGRKKEEL